MLNSLNKKIWIIVVIIHIFLYCFAQQEKIISEDSLKIELHKIDSLQTDSLLPDSLQTNPLEINKLQINNINRTLYNSAFLDSVRLDSVKIEEEEIKYDSVFYSADSVHYEFEDERIDFVGKTKLEFQGASIYSDTLSLDMKNEKAISKGRSYLEQGDHLVIGSDIQYDLKTRWGRIVSGASTFDLGYYYGDEIRKIDEKTFDIDNGYFTTCDAKEPHFFIGAKKFRMYQDDKVVAKPVVFYVNHVPVFALPFGTFSIKRGRQTGILVPSPGYNSSKGKYIEDIAFYYAHRNHLDATLYLNYYERKGWEIGLKSVYKTRYKMNGGFSAIMEKNTINPDRANYEWNVKGRHHHDYGNKTTLDANFNFYSSKTIWEDSSDIDERLSEKITSSIVYKQPFLGSNLRISANYTDDLKNKKKSIILPKLRYLLPSKPVYELFVSADGKSDAWWTNLSYSYNINALHSGTINDSSATFWDVIYKTKKDSTGYINQHNAGMKHSFSLSYRDKIKSWLNIQQSVNYNEAWFDRDVNENKLVRGFDYSALSRIWFSLYGLREFENSFLKAVRHVVTPKVSFNYSPDFSHNDKFYSFGGIGVSKGDRARSVVFSLNNGWDIKIAGNDESPDRKINDLFSISSLLSYNFEAENKRFSSISHKVRVKTGSVKYWLLDLSISPSGSLIQDFYRFKDNSLNYSKWNLAISDWWFQVTSKLTIGGTASYFNYFPTEKNDFVNNSFFEEETSLAADSLQIGRNIGEDNERAVSTLEEYDRMKRDENKWSIIFGHTYKTDKLNYEEHDYTSNMTMDINLRVTKNWYVTYGNSMNLKENEIISHNLSLVRDLHCWKIRLKYTRQANYWNYELKLFNIKLPNSLKFKTSDRGF